MSKYLGQIEINIEASEYKEFSEKDFAMVYIEKYGQIDGDHHKAWVLDHVARILLGTKVKIYEASWDDGSYEHRFILESPSQKYVDWVEEMKDDGEYDYEEGICP